MRITSKGQVTIPQAIREKLGLLPLTEVEFELEGNAVRILKKGSRRGQLVVEHLRRMKGKATALKGMSTDEIMQLLRGD
jgi:AbrB family looped-hinge helix DNA binding protein